MLLPHLAVLACVLPWTVLGALHTSGRWIVDEHNERFKLRCVNWAGHMEMRIPEGLQHQTIDNITSWIAASGFNCVRLTYSVDMALHPHQPVADAFEQVALAGFNTTGVRNLTAQVMRTNPFLATATVRDVFAAIISSLETKDLLVVLDNHVSKASWCCNYDDGNGWFGRRSSTQPQPQKLLADSAYKMRNSQFFDTDHWLQSLHDMATFARDYPNVVGMSLRNELRALGDQSRDDSWYEWVTAGATTIHEANPDLLIMVGGTRSAGDLSFLRHRPLDRTAFANRTVWEFHVYPWSYLFLAAVCPVQNTLLGYFVGFVLRQNQPYTGPLWLSEFGVGQTGGSVGRHGLGRADYGHLRCVVRYMADNDADWAVWALQGSYYVRDLEIDVDEPYGLMNANWTAWRNPEFKGLLGGMWNVTQLP